MKCTIGIDIGAVSVKAAVWAEGPLPRLEAAKDFAPHATPRLSGRLYLSEYRRTKGKPLAAATELLEKIIDATRGENVAGICLTGSGSKLAASKLGAAVVNEFKAIAAGLAALGVEARTVFQMGGESSKYLRLAGCADGDSRGEEVPSLRPEGILPSASSSAAAAVSARLPAKKDADETPVIREGKMPSPRALRVVDYATNGDCAAGTGSFIDQQANRLKLPVEEIGKLCLAASRAAQVAGRCSVFAKSDMIHAQQKGYSPSEVLRGLCDAVARNFRSAVVRSHPVEPPVAMLGGVAANAAVVRAMRETFGLDNSQWIVPEAYTHVEAIGAAVVAAQRSSGAALSHMADLRAASDSSGALPRQDTLSMDNVLLLRDREVAYEPPSGDAPIDGYMGIDIGSVSTNVVVVDPEGRVVVDIYVRTQGRPIEVVREALADVHRTWGDRIRILGVGTTGSGRELIGQLVGADTVNDEITAHKTGATFVGRHMLNGQVPDTIFEIGGQDSKYISLQDGIVVDFTMNDACAAGTGSFLEERAEELDISIIGQFAKMALSSKAPIRLGERCTVFMERDVNTCLQRGADKADLVAGLAYSVAYNYINRVVRGRKIGDCIFFQGGTAYNDSVAAAFAGILGKRIIVPPHNGVIGAIGAALLAQEKMEQDFGMAAAEAPGKSEKTIGTYVSHLSRASESHESSKAAIPNPKSRFRGYDVGAVKYSLREFTCKACSNACQIQEFAVEGEKTYWGDKCSDRYRKRSASVRKAVIDDLPALRMKWLMDDEGLPPAPPGAPKVGLPLTMFAWESLPLWRTLLRECGLDVVLSDSTNKSIVREGTQTAVAEPCFPVIVAHGHVANLLAKGVDWVFLPNIVSQKTRWMDHESFLCPWHQTLPFVIRRSPAFEKHMSRLIMPTVHFRVGGQVVLSAIQDSLRPLGVKAAVVAAALDRATQAQERFQSRLLEAGRKAMAALQSTGAPGVVLVGRPYNVHDAGVNLSAASKLRELYGVNCVPMDFLDTAGEDVTDLNDNMYWDLGRKMLAAARIVSRHDNLHIIHITNFKCGPDSFLRHFLRRAGGKPYLTLQFDGHSNDAGMMTRCEAYLDSKGILRPRGKAAPSPQADPQPAEAAV